MDVLFRYFLEFIVVLPVAFFAYIPMRNNTRFNCAFVFSISGIVIIIYSVVCAFICSIYGLSTNQVLIPSLPLFMIAYLFLVKGDIFKKLFCFFIAMMLGSFCTMYTVYLSAPIEAKKMATEGETDLFAASSSLICFGVFVVIFALFFRALFTWIPYLLEDVLLEKIWKKIFILPVVLTAFFYWLIPTDPRNLILFRARAIGIVLVSILPLVICGVFYIAWWMERKNRENTKTQQENEMLLMEKKRYREFSEYYNASRALRHDFRQQVLLINSYVADKEYEKLADCIHHINSQMGESPERFCANNAIDAVVTYYKDIADEKGISTRFVLNLPEELPLEEYEICTVLGNLLENAVRETSDVSGEKEIIAVAQMISDEMMGLSVENTFYGRINWGRDGLPKSERTGHGIGLRSVKATAERMKGTMNIKVDGKTFCVNLILQV